MNEMINQFTGFGFYFLEEIYITINSLSTHVFNWTNVLVAHDVSRGWAFTSGFLWAAMFDNTRNPSGHHLLFDKYL